MNKKFTIIIVAIAVIVLAAIIVLAYFVWIKQGGVSTPESFSIEECKLFSANEVKSSLKGDQVTETTPLKSEGQCRRMWVNMQGKGQNGIPKNTVTLNIIETQASSDYDKKSPKEYLDTMCFDQSLGIGQYNSCALAGFIFFGKDKYLFQVSCTGCPEEKTIELSKLAASRI